jgi:HEAT repeat protein
VTLFRRSEAKRLKKARDVEGLLVLAENGSDEERSDALLALTELELDDSQRRRAVDDAYVALDAGDDVAGAGVFVLGTFRVREAVPQLLEALRSGGDFTRLMAAGALGWLEPTEAYEPLRETALHDVDPLVRDQATRSLGSYPQAAETLHDIGTEAARDALRELGQEP